MEDVRYILEISIPVYLVFCLLYKIYKGKRKLTFGDYVFEFIFVVYIFTVLVILKIIPININAFKADDITSNLISDIKLTVGLLRIFLRTFLQVIIFIPLGFLYSLIVKRKNKIIRKIIAFSMVLSFIIETMEYFTGRYFNIEDIIFNVVGAVIGYYIYVLINNIINKKNS